MISLTALEILSFSPYDHENIYDIIDILVRHSNPGHFFGLFLSSISFFFFSATQCNEAMRLIMRQHILNNVTVGGKRLPKSVID
jgi:Cdc6-like AAA superfamily ATPase